MLLYLALLNLGARGERPAVPALVGHQTRHAHLSVRLRRTLVRADEIDLGLWSELRPAQLFVPLDTHMFRVCKAMGLTMRKQANFQATQDITRGFRRIVPEDPVKYDFALTRLGIRKDESMRKFLYEQRILKR